MGNSNHEVERLKRLRDQQLKARDPHKKQQKLQHSISTRYRESREPFSLTKIWQEVEQKWRGLLIGGFLGFIVLAILPSFLESAWAGLIVVGAILFLMLIGFAIGQAADSRDELRDLIHKR
jgi:VIT1/CCC1 family predicted Fe2+/Mn2+ transporter